jgi:hypothetical protein
MAKTNKKALAKQLYLRDDLTFKVIADNLDVNEKTIGRWAKDEKWELIKKSQSTSKADRLKELYDQMAWINERNKRAIEDDDPTTNPNYDDLAKVSKSIERLEKDAGIGDMIKTVITLINYVEKEDLEEAKTVSHWGYIFIQDKMKELK